MPHDTHTTHEPDRVGREGDEVALAPVLEDDVHRQATLLMFGGFAPPERELAPAVN
jgi:hypothetical protein